MTPVDTPVYSPSATEDWLRCSVFHDYRRRDLRPREERWTPNRLMGEAIAAGLAHHYRTIRASHDASKSAAVDVALATLDAGFVEQDEWTIDGLRKLVERGLGAALKVDVLGPAGKVVAVEERIGECQPDLVHREPTGLVVTDWKVTLDLDSRYEAKRLREYDHWWQGLHYAWRVGEHYGEPVHHAQVVIVVLSPRVRTIVHPTDTSPARVAHWLKTAEQVWADMAAEERGERRRTMNWKSCDLYGGCAYWDLCHHYYGDEQAANATYERTRT